MLIMLIITSVTRQRFSSKAREQSLYKKLCKDLIYEHARVERKAHDI
jgi:hypothetical protein